VWNIVPGKHARINSAIREGVEYCRHSGNLVVGMAKFLHELRSSDEWSEPEILAVDEGMRYLICGIVLGRDLAAPGNPMSRLTDSTSVRVSGI
jgi:hypothetical protein